MHTQRISEKHYKIKDIGINNHYLYIHTTQSLGKHSFYGVKE